MWSLWPSRAELPAKQRARRTRGAFFLYAFGFLIVGDIALVATHLVLFGRAWHSQNKEVLLELALMVTHFLTNTIALADIFVHLWRYSSDDECEFEPAKSTNAFLFSCIGTYADLVGVAFASPGTAVRAYAWALLGQGAASAAVSIACYVWGNNMCKPPRQSYQYKG